MPVARIPRPRPDGRKFHASLSVTNRIRLPRARAIAAVLLGSILWTCASPAVGHAAWTQDQFIIGTFLDPFHVPDPVASSRLYQQAADAYFNLLTGTPSDFYREAFRDPNLSFDDNLATAGALGLRYLVADPKFYLRVMRQYEVYHPTFDPVVAAQVTSHYVGLGPLQRSALYGYNLGDEPFYGCDPCGTISGQTYHACTPPGSCTGPLELHRSWVGALHAADPNKAVYVNLLGYGGAFPDTATYREYVHQYMNNSDPAHGFDIASFDSYPFYKNGGVLTYSSVHFFTLRTVKQEAGSKPVWYYPLAWPLDNLPTPDENQLRYMYFTPLAYGVKGLIDFGYTRGMGDFPPDGCMASTYYEGTNYFACPSALVDYWNIPTPRYFQVKRINHYVHDIVGPMIMSSTYVGTYHQSSQPSSEVIPSSEIIGASTPVVSGLGDPNGMVGIFQPSTPAGSYYLLLVNKALTPKTMLVSLRGAWDVGAAPRADGYVGGTNYISVATNTYGGDTQFGMTLSGGEGRLVRVQPPGTGVYLTMSSPVGGESRHVGDPVLTVWWPIGSTQSVRFFADATDDGTSLTGPSVVLQSSVSGYQSWVTIPDVMSTRARIEVTSYGVDGQPHKDYHALPMKVLPSPPFDWVYSPLGGPQSTFQHSIAIDAQAHGNVVYFDATSGHPFYAKSDGTNWTIVAVPDQIGGTNTPWPNAPSGTQGIQPSIVIDGLGHVHLAYYAVTSWPNSQLHYAMFDGTNWTIENVATVGVVDGGCSIAVNGAGVPFIAYNNGTAGGRNIAIVSRQGGTWATFGPAIGATGPQSIGAKFDASGNLFLAFTDQNGARIAVHRMTSSTNTLILSRSGNFRAVSLAVESGGVVHLAYSASSATPGAQTLTYDRWSGSAWLAVPEVADATLGTVEGLSIAAFMNSPQIAYAGNGVLKYANKTLGAWYHDAIDPSGDMTGPVSLALGGSGERWISYADRAGKTYRVSSPMTNGGGGDPCNPCDPCDPCEILPAIRSVTLTGPNPVHVGRPITFRIQTPGPMTFDVGLFDVAGRRVAGRESQQVRAGVETVQWTPNSIRAGIYFLRVRSEAGTELATRLMVLD